MKRLNIKLSIIVATLLISLGYWVFLILLTPKEPLVLRFYAYVGDDKLTLNKMMYKNLGGKGLYKIRDFQLFLSHIKLTGSTETLTVKDSYHLLRFDGQTPYAEITLPAVNAKDYDTIHWGVGVDPKANGTLIIAGDLDPNNRMAWNWQVGYKFVLVEGRLDTGDQLIPLVYHVGFDENYTTQSLPIAQNCPKKVDNALCFKVDLNALFDGAASIDMVQVPTIKFDPDDASRMARGFQTLISNY